VSETSITYTPSFKLAAVQAYKEGMTPAHIFIDAGFDLDIIGHDKPKQCLNRWRIAFSRYGEEGLLKERRGKGSVGRPSSNELTVEEKLRRAEARIQLLQAENDLLKKLETLERHRSEGLTTSERFQLAYDVIRKHRLQRLTRYVCKILEVSPSGYYRFVQTEEQRQQTKELEVLDYELIKQHFDRSGGKAGALTIKMKLERHHDVVMNHKKIRRIMRAYHLVATVRQTNPYRKLARATQEHLTCPNHLNRQFDQHEPEKVMLTDITYLHYGNGQCAYLSCVKDGATSEILAYHVASSISMNLVSETLNQLFERFQGNIHPEAIFHSD
jgi:putative transposase